MLSRNTRTYMFVCRYLVFSYGKQSEGRPWWKACCLILPQVLVAGMSVGPLSFSQVLFVANLDGCNYQRHLSGPYIKEPTCNLLFLNTD